MAQRWIVKCKNQHCGIDLVMELYLPKSPGKVIDWTNPAWKATAHCPECKETQTYTAADLELLTVPD